ncbi:MAG: hypothetical protein JRE18_08015 [Deltaproteobacteria bacterium]|nr:hypothetical protein [Deltaproteobacteria bacterium]
MDFFGTLNKLRRRVQQTIQPVVEPVYQNVNKEGSKVFDTLNQLYNRADQAVGGNLPGGVRPTSSPPPPSKGFLRQYIEEIPEKGAIPIPLTNVSKDARTVSAYGKSMLGPVGKPFRIMDNPSSSRFYQQAINAADYDPERQAVIFNENIQNQAEYDRLGRDLSNKDFGRFVGQVQPDSSVIVDDDYDTNRSALWHYNRLMSGKDKEGKELNLFDRAISGASGLHKKLNQAGWTNPHPFGAPGSVKIGTYQQ